MAGSVRLVNGDDMWELRVYLGRDESGRVRHVHRRFRGTRRGAERALARLVVESEDNVDHRRAALVDRTPNHRWNEKTTINDALEGWSTNGWEDLSPTTTRHYRELWDRHVRASIGRRRISDLSAYDVERYFRSLKSAGAGQATLRHIRGMLHRACRLARKWSGNTLHNPITDTELPVYSLQERRDPVRAPSNQEVFSLLSAAQQDDPRFAVFLRLVAATGVRRGEACALRWSDVDFDHRTVQVDESIVASSGGATVKAPKTRASIRKLALDGETLRQLDGLKEEQSKMAASCGVPLPPDGFVFSNEPGGVVPPHPDTVSKAFANVRRRAKLPADLHLHSLRHFHATVLDPVISEAQKQARLGWATVRMARHYTDAVPEEDRRAAEHVGKLLADPGPARGQKDTA
jgi:integrase